MPPNQPTTVIPFYALRLGHLITAKADLVVSCQACRRSGRLDVIDIACAKGRLYGVRELEKSLRCQRCGRVGWASVRIEWI